MSILNKINSPADLSPLTHEELVELSGEIRQFLIEKVSRSGGHLGPNLGVVELTLAIHRVFDSPQDPIIFDTGHQSYVHKIVTGRRDGFDRLRQRGGLAGYPSRAESEHDVVENSHASTALSWADGIARAFKVRGESDRTVVAVVGDGSLTGGMAWEALNNIATSDDLRLVIVVNDNERSYSPTIGGMAKHLSTLRATQGYEKFLDWGKEVLERTPVVGHGIYEALHGMKKGLKDFVAPQGLFEDLGIKYLGPIDGHDFESLERELENAKRFKGPVIVHAITEKGRGHLPALNDEAEKFHAVGVVDPETGEPLSPSGTSWTRVFSDELVTLGEKRGDLVAITAAMLGPTGLDAFARRFPDRTLDVGIAEQHATTSAAGMAFAGLHPVVAVYSTFLNRAFDQLLLDVALHKAGVTFVLDRSGITGDDGPSHHGIWDLALTSIVPGIKVAAPRDGQRLRELLAEAVEIDDRPSVIRFPKGQVSPELRAFERRDGIDILYRGESADILLIAVGAMTHVAVEAASIAYQEGVGVTVVDPRWVHPLPEHLVTMAERFAEVVILEDGIEGRGVATTFEMLLRQSGSLRQVHSFGVPQEFIEHSKRNEILVDIGMTGGSFGRRLVALRSSAINSLSNFASSIKQEVRPRQERENGNQ
ncbi:MAG: 1-deoxy-D-xylulose-5-phosphate synthase [Candidatus Nanopelagicaceae bacterium]